MHTRLGLLAGLLAATACKAPPQAASPPPNAGSTIEQATSSVTDVAAPNVAPWTAPPGHATAKTALTGDLEFGVSIEEYFEGFDSVDPVPFHAVLLRDGAPIDTVDSLPAFTGIGWRTWQNLCDNEWVPALSRKKIGDIDTVQLIITCARGEDIRQAKQFVSIFRFPSAPPEKLGDLDRIFSGANAEVRVEMGYCEWGRRVEFVADGQQLRRKRTAYTDWEAADDKDCRERWEGAAKSDESTFAFGAVEQFESPADP